MVYCHEDPADAKYLADKTGLDVLVVLAWFHNECQSVNNPTNPLNIRYTGTHGQIRKNSSGSGVYYTTKAGLDHAAWLINNGAKYSGVRSAIRTGDPKAEARAIEMSPWAASHYGGQLGLGSLSRTVAHYLANAKNNAKNAKGDPSLSVPKGKSLADFLHMDPNKELQAGMIDNIMKLGAAATGEKESTIGAFYRELLGHKLGDIPAPTFAFNSTTFAGGERSLDPITAITKAIGDAVGTAVSGVAKIATYTLAVAIIVVGIWLYSKGSGKAVAGGV